jgi:triacylglycerol lipase
VLGQTIADIWPSFSFPTDELHYFRNIRSHLQRRRYTVYHTNVAFTGGLAQRAQDLSVEVTRILAESGADKVHLIGHSMGGLDGRFLLRHNLNNLTTRVRSLTTIGTPHLGTSFADWGLSPNNVGQEAIVLLRLLFNLDANGFLDLTTASCAAFNAEAEPFEAANKVVYQVVGSAEAETAVFAPLQPSCRLIQQFEGQDPFQGANDGLVSLASQYWARELRRPDGTTKQVLRYGFPVPADHLNQLGWWDLDELAGLHWWQWRPLWRRWRFETAVKQFYTQLAHTLWDLSL